jgi:O-antigen/teichoic acid export membrane protein
MSQIRKKSLTSSIWIYLGFIIGAINTYFLTHKAWFSTNENGLTRVMLEIGMLLYSFSTLGITSFLYKFFPYYEDNLSPKKNDILTVSLVVACCGFAITATTALLFEPVIIRKFSANSLLLVQYFYWSLPMAFLMLIYGVLEAYSYGFNKGVLTGILKETVLRLYTSVIILLKIFDLVSFKTFIKLFSFQYGVIVIILLINLYLENKLWLAFNISRVTKKFRKKIFAMLSLTIIVVVVGALRQTIDGIVLASKQNLGKVAIFGFAAYMVSVLQVPLRSIIAITIPVLSRSWKNKDIHEITRIYKRSSINLLSFSLFAFFCIWLNFTHAINFFGINPDYLEGRWVFFLLGMVTIIEMGTGVNAQIIGTSTYWRFELWTGLLLTALIIPLSYILTVKYAIMGPAIANIISFTIYNTIRYVFLWKKFNMQPFSSKTIEVIMISGIDYLLCYLLFDKMEGLIAMILRTALFAALFIATIYWRNISPDLKPIAASLLKRVNKKKVKL